MALSSRMLQLSRLLKTPKDIRAAEWAALNVKLVRVVCRLIVESISSAVVADVSHNFSTSTLKRLCLRVPGLVS